jgi:hypothetical protein
MCTERAQMADPQRQADTNARARHVNALEELRCSMMLPCNDVLGTASRQLLAGWGSSLRLALAPGDPRHWHCPLKRNDGDDDVQLYGRRNGSDAVLSGLRELRQRHTAHNDKSIMHIAHSALAPKPLSSVARRQRGINTANIISTCKAHPSEQPHHGPYMSSRSPACQSHSSRPPNLHPSGIPHMIFQK